MGSLAGMIYLWIIYGRKSIANTIVQFIFVVVWILFLIFNKKIEKWLGLINIIGVGLFFGVTLSFYHDLSDRDMTIFMLGYNCGLLHSLGLNHFQSYETVLVVDIIFWALRSYLLAGIGFQVIFVQIVLDLYLLAIRLVKEKNEVSLFKKMYHTKLNLVKFQYLLENYLPEAIIVISRDLKKALFYNQAYKKIFEIIDIQTSEKEAVDILEAIKVDEIKEELKSKAEVDTFHEPTLLDSLRKIINHKQTNENLRINCTYLRNNKAKEVTRFEAKILPCLWEEENAVIVVLNDITHQENVIALRIADANKDKVISTVSHELRTPVNGLLGMIQIMEKQTNDKDLLHSLSICRSNGNLLMNLLNSILDLQRIRANKLKMNISKINLSKFMHEILPLFEFQTTHKGLSLKLEMDPKLPLSIQTDPNRLMQIIINLTANALKFTFKGSITIGVQKDPEDDKKIQFSITDTGIGIKEEDKGKLFKMFGKLEDNESINTQGVGLGLTISANLVKLLNMNEEGAWLKFESEYGKGSRFFFSIPSHYPNENSLSSEYSFLTEEDPELDFKILSHSSNKQFKTKGEKDLERFETTTGLLLSPPKEGKNHFGFEEQKQLIDVSSHATSAQKDFDKADTCLSSACSSPVVLLVDDNPFNILVAKKIIEAQNYIVHTAYNGQQAISVVKSLVKQGNTIKIIFMDCQMPVMDGFEATIEFRKLMASHEIPNIKIVALSANDAEEDKKRCISVGMNDHLSKPLKEADLVNILNRLG